MAIALLGALLAAAAPTPCFVCASDRVEGAIAASNPPRISTPHAVRKFMVASM